MDGVRRANENDLKTLLQRELARLSPTFASQNSIFANTPTQTQDGHRELTSFASTASEEIANIPIADLLENLNDACQDMKESEETATRVYDRAFSLHETLPDKLGDFDSQHACDVISAFRKTLRNSIAFLENCVDNSLLSRVASNRAFLVGVEEMHQELDHLAYRVNRTNANGTVEWKDQLKQDKEAQLIKMTTLAANDAVVEDLKTLNGNLIETLTELKYEIDRKRARNAAKHVELVELIESLIRRFEGSSS